MNQGNPGVRPGWSLLGYLLLTFLAAGLGSLATSGGIESGWYAGLNKPAWNPPNWVFGPVWTVLYILIAVSAWRISLKPDSSARRQALMWFVVQLTLNAIWSWLFFGFRQPGVALAGVVLLLSTVIVTTLHYARLDRPAAAMMVPYVLWTAFATALNLSIWMLNR